MAINGCDKTLDEIVRAGAHCDRLSGTSTEVLLKAAKIKMNLPLSTIMENSFAAAQQHSRRANN